MNKYVVVLVWVFSCAWVQGEETALKDPTAPFNSQRSTPLSSARAATKNTSPRWVLDGVLISEEGKKALLNGRWYNERDHVNGWQLVQVDTAAVVLKQAGKTQRILLYPSLTKNTLTLKPE